jgi:plasmid stabilization system protein ParE
MYGSRMGVVVSLADYRERRDGPRAAVDRLDRAVAALDPLVQARRHRLSPTIERELRAIGRAVSSGDARAAAERAERLVDLLEHPAASG